MIWALALGSREFSPLNLSLALSPSLCELCIVSVFGVCVHTYTCTPSHTHVPWCSRKSQRTGVSSTPSTIGSRTLTQAPLPEDPSQAALLSGSLFRKPIAKLYPHFSFSLSFLSPPFVSPPLVSSWRPGLPVLSLLASNPSSTPSLLNRPASAPWVARPIRIL